VVFVVAGVVAFFAVKATVVGLAAVMSVLFIIWGILGVVTAIAARRERGWRVPLIAGLAELAIRLWVATSLHASITTLLISVAAGTVIHGIGGSSAAADTWADAKACRLNDFRLRRLKSPLQQQCEPSRGSQRSDL